MRLMVDDTGMLDKLIDMGATPIEFEGNGPTTLDSDKPPVIHLSHDEQQWLDTLPLRQQLTGDPRSWFEMAALFYRAESKLASRQAYVSELRKLCSAFPDNKLKTGTLRFIGRKHPRYWTVCPDCLGTGKVDSGRDRCGGYGFNLY